MSNLKKIGNKLFKEEKVKLSMEVKLSLISDLDQLNNSYYTNTDSANSSIKNFLSEARKAESKIEQAIKSANKIKSSISKVEKQAKDIGIDLGNIPELKSAKLALSESKEYKLVLSKIKSFISSI